jgi:hypothetical protein
MLADPGFRITELVSRPNHFEVPFLTSLQVPFRRMRWHQKKS